MSSTTSSTLQHGILTPAEQDRERETFRIASDFITKIYNESGGCDDPQSIPEQASLCPDPALTALAKLGAVMLHTTRCLISLFDRKNQLIVAEATATTSLVPGHAKNTKLWLSGIAIPRNFGICEHVLLEDTKLNGLNKVDLLPISVVPDLANDGRFCNRPYIMGHPYNRFYAGVPIRSSNGATVGVYCVFDERPRDSLSDTELQFLREISVAVSYHLLAAHSSSINRRAESMVQGLNAFVGNQPVVIRTSKQDNLEEVPDTTPRTVLAEELRAIPIPHLEINDEPRREATSLLQRRTSPRMETSLSHKLLHPSAAEGATIPATDLSTIGAKPAYHIRSEIKDVFAKAAATIVDAIDAEGALFIDARVNSFGGLVDRGRNISSTSSYSGSDDVDVNSEYHGTRQEASRANCEVLGYGYSEKALYENSRLPNVSISERFLRKLLNRYPLGHVFNLDEHGESPGASSEDEDLTSFQSAKSSGQSAQVREIRRIGSLFPRARSVILIPCWDLQKKRWYAGGFVWTEAHTRVFTVQTELNYLRAFSLAIMAEICRAEGLRAEKAHSHLLGSISHELRTPLHGVISAVGLMRDSSLTIAQEDILHTIESSGATLLDVIDHLLDYSDISQGVQTPSDVSLMPRESRSSSQKRVFGSRITPRSADVHIDRLIEECVDSLFAGHIFQSISVAQASSWRTSQPRNDTNSGHCGADVLSQFDPVAIQDGVPGLLQGLHSVCGISIYLHIDPKQAWLYRIEAGALRRIIINLVGNSLKFTDTGHVYVGLQQETINEKKSQTRLKLTVSDTGKGINQDFLHNNLFKSFSQEDPSLPGTGLGLSLVKRIVQSLHGKIRVQSQAQQGTSISITIPIIPTKTDPHNAHKFTEKTECLEGRRVLLQGFHDSQDLESGGGRKLTERHLMESLCQSWLGMDVLSPTSHDDTPDVYLCRFPSDGNLQSLQTRNHGVPVIFVCPDVITTHRLQESKQYSSEYGTFKFVSQPIGPQKLLRAMLTVLTSSNHAHQLCTTQSVASTSSAELSLSSEKTRTATETYFPRLERDTSPLESISLRGAPVNSIVTGSNRKFRGASIASTTEPHPPTPIDSIASCQLSQSSVADSVQKPLVLLVDDNGINLRILTAWMRKLKFPYKCAENGLEAFQTYIATPDPIKYIFMDVSMPVMDGLESTRKIREFEKQQMLPSAKVIALTSLTSEEAKQEAFASGVNVFMTKPAQVSKIATLLDS